MEKKWNLSNYIFDLKLLADAVNSHDVKLRIFHGDALTFPMGQHINRDYSVAWESDSLPNAYLVGNLPFNIATPLLFKLLLKCSSRTSVFSCGRIPMTFLFQEEFAERMICPPGFKERSRVFDSLIIVPDTCYISSNFIWWYFKVGLMSSLLWR